VKFLLEVCSVPSAKAHNKHEEQTTHIYTEAFKDILDIYEQIGRALPSLSMYKELFKDESDLEKVMIATYSDIIQANQLLVIYFQRRCKTNLSQNPGSMLTAISLDRALCYDMAAAQV
jgi:predicted ATP-binding protein involved in virulence